MPDFTFPTPAPVAVDVELGAGALRFTATDRADTVVEVRPSDPHDESDVRAAGQVRVDRTGDTIRIVGPRFRMLDFSRKGRSVDVTVALPSGSGVTASVQAGDIRGVGRLGACRLATSAGNVGVEDTGPLRVDVSAGHTTVGHVAGTAEIATSSGRVQLGEVDGNLVVKNSNGVTTVDAVTGDLRVRSSNGDITVDHAGADVDAKTSNGTVRIGEVARGSVTVGTSMGDLEVGIAEGTAAWLEVGTSFGEVRNLLDTAVGPDDAEQTVEVRGRTSYGDVIIRRAP